MEKQEITQEQYYTSQKLESLARQNAQQAVRIADLEATLSLISAQQKQESGEEQQEMPLN